jgi:cation diffusion facilitator family transporter
MTRKERTAAISLLASFLLAGAKLFIGLMIGSLALITDALHSGVDFLATGMTLTAVRYGDRPPDESHPYGHGKFENIAALGEAALLLLLAGGVTVEALGRLSEGDAPPDLSLIAVFVLLVEIAINAWRAHELRKVGRETGSAALQADALHFASDVFSSLAVLAGFALLALGYGWADSAAALAVAVLVAVLALRLLRHTIDALVDRVPPGLAALVGERIADLPGVLEVTSVRLRSVGAQHFVEAAIAVPRGLSLEQAAAVKAEAAAAARGVISGAEAVIDSVPVTPSDETIAERIQLVARREGVAVHHLTIQHLGEGTPHGGGAQHAAREKRRGAGAERHPEPETGEPGRLAVALDLEVDGAMALAEAHAVADRLETSIRREIGGDAEVEIHIEPLEPETREVAESADPIRANFQAALEGAARLIEGLSDIHDVRLRESERGYVLVAHCRFDSGATVESVHRRVDALENAVRARMPNLARIVVHAEPRRN